LYGKRSAATWDTIGGLRIAEIVSGATAAS
jgi:hypothetical protein